MARKRTETADRLLHRAGADHLTTAGIAAADRIYHNRTVPLDRDIEDTRPCCLVFDTQSDTRLAKLAKYALTTEQAGVVNWVREDFTYFEISVQLGISASTVRRHYLEACDRLERYLATDPYCDLPEVMREVFPYWALLLAGY